MFCHVPFHARVVLLPLFFLALAGCLGERGATDALTLPERPAPAGGEPVPFPWPDLPDPSPLPDSADSPEAFLYPGPDEEGGFAYPRAVPGGFPAGIPREEESVAPDAPPAFPAGELLRPNPSYVQWLERQSLLRKAPDLAAIVSGSSLPWNAPSTVSDLETLLTRASLWFAFNPFQATWGGGVSPLAAVARNRLPENLAALGVQGLFLSPTAESGLAWNPNQAFWEQGRDSVSFAFAQDMGTMEDYAAIEEQAAARQIWIGGDTLPSATGLGPDFALGVRGVREYPGLFMLVDVPPDAWALLPLNRINDGSIGRPLETASVVSLARQGVIPPAFFRDGDRQVAPGGWAATQTIVGMDGVSRRWIYRYVGSPLRPVLNWDDPSAAAKRVLSASVIQQVGILHQALVGVSVGALWGQDPAPPGGRSGLTDAVSAEPALSALRALSREIRRYGAWSLLRDVFPAGLIPLLQGAGVDFTPDTVVSPALEYAMLSGDAAPLNQALRDSLARGVDHSRLWRSTADGEGIRFGLSGLAGRDALKRLPAADPWRAVMVLKDNVLFATAPSLAALAAGLSLEDARKAAASPGQGEEVGVIRRGHMLQLAFRLMLPGLVMLSGSDADGTLFAPNAREFMPSVAAWSLDGARMPMTRKGVPLGLSAYLSLSAQKDTEGSFARELSRLTDVRQRSGVARGRVAAVADVERASATGVLTSLPGGGYLLLAGNFSGDSFTADVRLPPGLILPHKPGTDMLSGGAVAVGQDSVRLDMGPWQYRVVYIRAAE